MTEANTQAVVDDTEAAPVAAAEVDGARKDELSPFLEEYERQTRTAQPKQPEPAPVIADPVLLQIKSEWDALKQERASEKNSADIANVTKAVKGDLDVPDFVVKGWIDDKADKSPALKRIFENRYADPEAWKRAEKGLVAEFAKEEISKAYAKKIDPEATGDRVAVAAAVRGSSTKAPDSAPPKLGNLSNAEFNDWVKQNVGFHPGV